MITIISCGINNAPLPPGDLTFDCRSMPDPSPVVHDLPGTDPLVLKILEQSNPMVFSVVKFLIESVMKLAEHQDDVVLVLFCSAGWHRSVAIAETVGRLLQIHHGYGVGVIHRDLRVKT